MKHKNLYDRERDVIAYGEHYAAHIGAMTREDLHEKSDIAAELGWRDSEIERLKKENEKLMEFCAAFFEYAHRRYEVCGENPHAKQMTAKVKAEDKACNRLERALLAAFGEHKTELAMLWLNIRKMRKPKAPTLAVVDGKGEAP